MRCPSCKEPDTRVVDSRDLDDGAVIRRRRACRICGTRVTTYERAELAKLYVIKRSGERQEYDSLKLLEGLRRALAATHGRYAAILNARRKRSGHFWQGRFGCVALDEAHLAAAVRYVCLNPVRARLVERVLERPLVDGEQQVALLDDLPVGEMDAVEIARHTRANLDRIHRDETSDIFVVIVVGTCASILPFEE